MKYGNLVSGGELAIIPHLLIFAFLSKVSEIINIIHFSRVKLRGSRLGLPTTELRGSRLSLPNTELRGSRLSLPNTELRGSQLGLPNTE